MRSFSIHVGRLFGVEVRLHLTFLILPLFVFWTEYNVHPLGQRTAGPGAGGHRAGLRLRLMKSGTCLWPGAPD